jgi:hypothetical protein
MLVKKIWLCLLAGIGLSAACAVAPATPPLPPDFSYAPTAGPAATALVSVGVAIIGATPTKPSIQGRGDAGINATLADYRVATGDDLTGSKTAAFTTLKDFSNPRGIYSRSWWFADDGRANISEVLAVILYTEGNTNWDVRTAVAARYLWYCAGLADACEGHDPWRRRVRSQSRRPEFGRLDRLAPYPLPLCQRGPDLGHLSAVAVASTAQLTGPAVGADDGRSQPGMRLAVFVRGYDEAERIV